MDSNGFVNLEMNNNIATITFHHPKSNSLPSALLEQIESKFELLRLNEEIKVIILQSEGKTFCAGASFDELISLENFEDAREFFSGFARVINSMRKSSQIIIAKIHGKTIGGGVGIAAAADYAIASRNASVRLSELSIGIAPFVIGPAVERKIGKSAFSEMSIDAEWKSSEWAYEKGLYNKVTEDKSALDAAVNELAEKLSSYSKYAIAELKSVLWENTENWDLLLSERAEKSGKLALTDFTREILKKFKEAGKK